MSELSVGQLKGLTVNNNVISVPSGHALYAPGSVVQTKYNTNSTATIYNTTSFVEILSVTITPQKTNSLVLVGFSLHVSGTGGLQIVRNGTKVWGGPEDLGGPYMFFENPTNQGSAFSSSTRQLAMAQFMDSPSTTSSLTYSLQIKARGTATATNIGINETNTGSNVVTILYAQEIAQ